MTQSFLGIVGGSGIYEMPGFEDAEWRTVASPWGEPSDAVRIGRIGMTRVAFLPRHGRGHRLAPGDINYRANIDVLKRIGVTDLVSVSAVGSLKEDLSPGTFVLVDQFIASELNWRQAGVKLRQETNYPDESSTKLTVTAAPAASASFATGRIPLARQASASAVRLALPASSSPKVMVWMRGVMPRSLAAARSTLLKPAARSATRRTA